MNIKEGIVKTYKGFIIKAKLNETLNKTWYEIYHKDSTSKKPEMSFSDTASCITWINGRDNG